MAVYGSVSFTASAGGVSTSGITSSSTGSLADAISVAVPASTTDQLYTIAIDISELESIFLVTDGALTIETNSSSAPDDTFVFTANMPLVWVSGFPTIDGASGNPFDADVTKMYLTNGTASEVTLTGYIIQSP